MNRHVTLFLLFGAVVSACAPALADDDDEHRQRATLDAAVKRGEVLQLSEILARVRSKIKGKIVEIEFEYSKGAPIYEIYILNSEGRRLEYEIDARTARILGLEDDD